MTPQEKAKELVDRYWLNIIFPTTIEHAKQCAIICVDEVMEENSANNVANDCAWVKNPETNKYDITNEQFWQQVKQAVNNL